jgi:hypothetical protein
VTYHRLTPHTTTNDPTNRPTRPVPQDSYPHLAKHLPHHTLPPQRQNNVSSKNVPSKTNGVPHNARNPPTCRYNNLVDLTGLAGG